MKVRKILDLLCIMALTLPMLASAEIYKWKDKNGVTRYSDTPPPVTIKADTLGKTGTAKPRPSAFPNAQEKPNAPAAPRDSFEESPVDSQKEAARMRARNAETEKKNREEKERMDKLNKENCKAAKANYQTFSQGGRIYKTNEKGEREYYGDDELNVEKNKAQREVRKFCK